MTLLPNTPYWNYLRYRHDLRARLDSIITTLVWDVFLIWIYDTDKPIPAWKRQRKRFR
jgi:hypothetical protein